MWIEALEDWPLDQIRWGLRQWVMDNPSKRPNFGHISQLLKAKRGEVWAARQEAQPEPQRDPPCSKEAAAEIMRQAGFSPKRFA